LFNHNDEKHNLGILVAGSTLIMKAENPLVKGCIAAALLFYLFTLFSHAARTAVAISCLQTLTRGLHRQPRCVSIG
jgi:hypothetical protein